VEARARRRLRDLVLSALIFVVGAVGWDVAMTTGIGSPESQKAWHVQTAIAVLGDYHDEHNGTAWNFFDVGSLILLAIGFLATSIFGLAALVRRITTGRWME